MRSCLGQWYLDILVPQCLLLGGLEPAGGGVGAGGRKAGKGQNLGQWYLCMLVPECLFLGGLEPAGGGGAGTRRTEVMGSGEGQVLRW